MPKITEIEVQKRDKNRVNIYLDGEFAFGLSLEVLMSNRLKKGDEIGAELRDKLLMGDEYNIALNKAVSYVSKAIKTKRQVVTYLKNKGYATDTVYAVVDKLKEYKYIDDVEYAKKYFELSQNKQGKKLADFKLMEKGIRKEDIEKAFAETNIEYKENARLVFEKYMRNKEYTWENIQKASRYLYGKGFSYDEIDSVVSTYKD